MWVICSIEMHRYMNGERLVTSLLLKDILGTAIVYWMLTQNNVEVFNYMDDLVLSVFSL